MLLFEDNMEYMWKKNYFHKYTVRYQNKLDSKVYKKCKLKRADESWRLFASRDKHIANDC